MGPGDLADCLAFKSFIAASAPHLSDGFNKLCVTVFPHCVELGGTVCSRLLIVDKSVLQIAAVEESS